jgi:hypothetical protein
LNGSAVGAILGGKCVHRHGVPCHIAVLKMAFRE